MHSKYQLALVLTLLLSLGGGRLYAQVKGDTEAGSAGLERWSFKTNVVDWFATIPNATVEWDVPDSWYANDSTSNKLSLSLTARYNWNTSHSRLSYNVFNLMQIRPEVRYWWHPREGGMSFKQRRQYAKNSNGEVSLFYNWLEDVAFMKKAKEPVKAHRAYYLGAYLDAGTYTFKLGQYGYQGQMYSIGFSAGYGVPMYQYKTGFIDVELGFSLGLSLVTSDAFMLDGDANRYVHLSGRSKGLHVAPFPVISQLNLSFAWRSKSIKDKYIMSQKEIYKLQDDFTDMKEKKDERKARRDAAKEEKAARKDSKEGKDGKPEKEKKVKPEKAKKEKKQKKDKSAEEKNEDQQ